MHRELALVVALCAVNAACSSPRTTSPTPSRLAAVESSFAALRAVHDRIAVTKDAGRSETADGVPLAGLEARHDSLRTTLSARLAVLDSAALFTEDRRALAVMRTTLDRDLTPVEQSAGSSTTAPTAPDCDYDASAIGALTNGLDSLRSRIYACYAWSQHHVIVAGDSMDRLSVLSALGTTSDAEQRRRLFLSLEPTWRSVNRDGGPTSPYRMLLALERRARAGRESPLAQRSRALGLDPASVEQWLLSVLGTWRAVTQDSLREPWDWYYAAGGASRKLGSRIPLDRLATLDREVFRALGADPVLLNVHYDLTPREGKTPVAFTDFGARPARTSTGWTNGEPWVFATYRAGGLDNLIELLHETGHAVHIAAIRTRPAFMDWPDSDPFTEALGDFVALDAYEPAWQQRWLGDSVPLAEGLRARYAGIVMDVAWALFEVRLERNPEADPNQVWTEITRDYLRIEPHPEWSWWAMRGQLVDGPGYMLNYALGAFLTAQLRARIRELRGSWTEGDEGWYAWVREALFRWGQERPTSELVEEFLGGPVRPEALLADLAS